MSALLVIGAALLSRSSPESLRRSRLPTGLPVLELGPANFIPGQIGAVTKVAAAPDGSIDIACGRDRVKVAFHSATTIRIWLASQDPITGDMRNFTNPAGAEGSPGHKPCKA